MFAGLSLIVLTFRGSLEVEVKGTASLEIIARDGDAFIGVPISLSGQDGSLLGNGKAGAGGYDGGEFAGRGFGPGGGIGGLLPGGGGYGGAGGRSSSTTGQPYGVGSLVDFVGVVVEAAMRLIFVVVVVAVP